MNENKIQKNDEILYLERVPVGKFVKIVIISLWFLNSSVGIIIIAFVPEELMYIGLMFSCVSLLILLLYWNFRGLRIILTRNQLEIDYRIFNHKRIPLKIICRCEIAKAYFRRYGGVGNRLELDGL